MLPLSLFRDRVTAMALLAAMILNLPFYGELFMLPFYFQNVRHYSVLVTGLAILPLPGLALMGSYLGGQLVSKIEAWFWCLFCDTSHDICRHPLCKTTSCRYCCRCFKYSESSG
jgi:hypothetical protein